MITNEVIESYLRCKYKSYLNYHNEKGDKTEYELLKKDIIGQYKTQFYHNLQIKQLNYQVLQEFEFGNKAKVRNKTYAIAPVLQTKELRISFDCLEISPHKDSHRKFSYFPISLSPKEKVSRPEKLSLAVKCLLLRQMRIIKPEFVKFIYGRNLQTTKISLKPYLNQAYEIVKELTQICKSIKPPRFYQNNHCQICEFKKICRAKLLEKDDLSLLGGMSEKNVLKKNNRGIFTIHQLSFTYRSRRKLRLVSPNNRRLSWELKALALREKQTYIREIPKFPDTETELYIDIEGLPDENFYYLIGLLIKQGESENQLSFWADTKEDEEKIFKQIFGMLSEFKDFTIYHYGGYETRAFRKINRKLGNAYEEEISLINQRSVNLLTNFSSSIYPPTYTNSLKEIANYLGFSWSEKNASGIQSIVWRKKWELLGQIIYKEKVIQYNTEDCQALRMIKQWIAEIATKIKQDGNKNFVKAENIKKDSYLKWGQTEYQLPNFEKINKYAYFDYQRTKIYLRTSKSVKVALKKEMKVSKSLNKIDKIIQLSPEKCPQCNCLGFDQLKSSKKVVVDLKFLKYGLKKWVTEYHSGIFRCQECRNSFVPDKYKIITKKYGHNLIAWSINQSVAHSVEISKISRMLSEMFSIHLSVQSIRDHRSYFIEAYSETYEEIKQLITTGPLLHADETTAQVKDVSSGYVWVFANMDSVLYMFKPNREADFLKDLLKGFEGILITDFYTGYDSLPCLQQKCLIHLIRDLNNDLLKNQLDLEFKNIVSEFGKLLRTIVETIDKYGLKKAHLNKHLKDVSRFYKRIVNNEYESEIAKSYKKRFTKNKDKLFTFLKYDGIPWNNNNAEHAIKPFARYRTDIKGQYTQKSIGEYLILLSIQQTCKYRGLSFLDFLKTKERSFKKFQKKF